MDERMEHEALGRALDRCAELIEGDHLAARSPAISGWSVGEQVDHLLRAGGAMLKATAAIASRQPGLAEGGGPNPVGQRILASGQFPRGVGQAPERTRPQGEPTAGSLRESLARVRARHESLAAALGGLGDPPGRVDHPFFGPLAADHWLRVARLHSEHHLAIVDEILAAGAA